MSPTRRPRDYGTRHPRRSIVCLRSSRRDRRRAKGSGHLVQRVRVDLPAATPRAPQAPPIDLVGDQRDDGSSPTSHCRTKIQSLQVGALVTQRRTRRPAPSSEAGKSSERQHLGRRVGTLQHMRGGHQVVLQLARLLCLHPVRCRRKLHTVKIAQRAAIPANPPALTPFNYAQNTGHAQLTSPKTFQYTHEDTKIRKIEGAPRSRART
eukprot:COSAG01_NODE_1828_length_9126_cov_53.025479_1_plen_208_part_00